MCSSDLYGAGVRPGWSYFGINSSINNANNFYNRNSYGWNASWRNRGYWASRPWNTGWYSGQPNNGMDRSCEATIYPVLDKPPTTGAFQDRRKIGALLRSPLSFA